MNDLSESERYQLRPENIFLHGDWHTDTIDYDSDLSLLQFGEGKIVFNAFVQPICLWSSENEPTVVEGTVAGWRKKEDSAKKNVLKVDTALIQTNGHCLQGQGQLESKSKENTFCAGLHIGSSVCTGDNGGGGLFIKVDGVYHLKGVVSSKLVEILCDVWENAVFTNVLKFNVWIEIMTGMMVSSSTKGL